jgi:hypothetical protein
MFTIDNVVDTAAKNTKTVIGYIPNDVVRTNFETLVDAHAVFTKTFWNTGVEMAKHAADNVVKYTTDATKAKK